MKEILKYLFLGLFIGVLLTYDFFNYQFLKNGFESFSIYLFPENGNAKGELFKIILTIFGAIAVIYGLYVSLRRAKAMEKGVEKQGESIENQTAQLELSRKSQIDERFKNAIEHLGSDKEPIILGGIAELHQIAKGNKQDYSEIVFNILCSYIRTSSDIRYKNHNEINRTAIQTIINYIFKKNSNNNLYDSYRANLKYSNLVDLDLTDCNLFESNLSSCKLPHLKNSNLKKSNLSRSIFRVADIDYCDFSETNLFHTIFHFCNIRITDFSDSKLSKTSFLQSHIHNVKFDYVSFNDTDFSATYFSEVSLNGSEIISANFSCASIVKIDFSKLKLFGGCDFRAASINDCNFKIRCTGSKFSGLNYDINEHPRLFKRRLEKRANKECELVKNDKLNLGRYKNVFDKLTTEDCNEISKEIEKAKKITVDYFKEVIGSEVFNEIIKRQVPTQDRAKD